MSTRHKLGLRNEPQPKPSVGGRERLSERESVRDQLISLRRAVRAALTPMVDAADSAESRAERVLREQFWSAAPIANQNPAPIVELERPGASTLPLPQPPRTRRDR